MALANPSLLHDRSSKSSLGLTASKAFGQTEVDTSFNAPVRIGRGEFPRRSRLEVCLDILESIRECGQAGPTHLIFKANLSTKLFRSEIEYLIQRALVDRTTEGKRELFFLTPLGFRTLTLASQLGSLLMGDPRSNGEGIGTCHDSQNAGPSGSV